MATQLAQNAGGGAAAGSSFGPWGAAIGAGLGALGGAISDAQGAKMTAAQMRQRKLEFELMLQNQRGTTAMGVQQTLDNQPLRDRLAYNINARLGMPQREFRPNDMFNPMQAGQGPPQSGGIDMAALAELMSKYQPGAGGQSTKTAQQFLSLLGYGPHPQPQVTKYIRSSRDKAPGWDYGAGGRDIVGGR